MGSMPDWIRTLSPVDWLVLVGLAYWIVRGIGRGLPEEAARLLVLLITLLGGWPLFGFLTAWLSKVQPDLRNRAAGQLLCFVVCALLVYAVARLVRLTVSKSLGALFEGWIVKIGGAFAGGLRFALGYVAFLLLVTLVGFADLRHLVTEDSAIGRRLAAPVGLGYERLADRLTFLPQAMPGAGDAPEVTPPEDPRP